MGGTKRINETSIHNGNGGKRLVRPGDSVDLLSPDYLSQKDYENLRAYIGTGPFRISGIGKWPCGTEFFYFNVRGREIRERAFNFRYVGTGDE